MAAEGVDLLSPRVVDFEHCFPDEDSARRFREAALSQVTVAELIPPDEDYGSGWEVQCRQRMVPTHAAISETELRLAAIAERFGGHSDGWGSSSNPDGSPAE